MKEIDNPWLNITSDNIAACDAVFFNSYGSLKDYEEYVEKINDGEEKVELAFSALPDPFCGNPKSQVYCLDKNPGKPDPSFANVEEFKDETLKNLRLEQDSCFWAEDITNESGNVHAGVDWLKRRTKQLEERLGLHPDIFFIEYFPYHSTRGFDFPEYLPSYEFTNKLIEDAMNEGKMIIIMREKKKWLKRINGLVDYHNLYTLRYPRGGYLTQNNIIKEVTIGNKEINKFFKIK